MGFYLTDISIREWPGCPVFPSFLAAFCAFCAFCLVLHEHGHSDQRPPPREIAGYLPGIFLYPHDLTK